MTDAQIVQAQVPTETMQQAATALEAIGLSVGDAIRLLMVRLAEDQRLPFDAGLPNEGTNEAIRELELGGGRQFDGADALFKDLGI